MQNDLQFWMDKDNWDRDIDQDINETVQHAEQKRLAQNDEIGQVNEIEQDKFLKENG